MADQSYDNPLLVYAYMYCSDCLCVYRSICVCMLQWLSLNALGLANDSRIFRISIWSIPLGKQVLGTTDK